MGSSTFPPPTENTFPDVSSGLTSAQRLLSTFHRRISTAVPFVHFKHQPPWFMMSNLSRTISSNSLWRLATRQGESFKRTSKEKDQRLLLFFSCNIDLVSDLHTFLYFPRFPRTAVKIESLSSVSATKYHLRDVSQCWLNQRSKDS